MDDRERLAWLALCWGAEIGPAGFARLLSATGSAEQALQLGEAELTAGEARLRPEQAQAIQRVRHELDSYGELAGRVQESGATIHYSFDQDYPQALRELSHPPPVVCIKGRLMPADTLAVGIVGTRTPTPEGAELAERLAMAAAADEFTVISGLARGVDTAAHTGALGHEGRTIAIIGSGINNITPPENEGLAERIISSGAVISELPPAAQPTIPNLMARNRLISLFSRGVIVVECRATGGSLATAQSALQQGRRLYAVKWPNRAEACEGNEKLFMLGAEPIQAPRDMRWVGLELRSWQPHPGTPQPPEQKDQLALF